ncbi:hypothetical protein CROQUDRAFT_679907, partial [Cronartium quercuum f. sp. fusiforme G11]
LSWLETVAIKLGILMLMKIGNYRSRKIIVWTDNTTTKSAIKKRKSRSITVTTKWKEIQKLLIKNQLDLEPRRVTSGENRADALSRGDWTGLDPSNQILIVIPEDLVELLAQCHFLSPL